MEINNFSTNFFSNTFIGGISGTLAKTITAPLERIKLVLQIENYKKNQKINSCFNNIYKKEGILGFWKGNWINIIRYFPSQGLNFGIKGYFTNFFELNNNSNKFNLLFKNLIIGGLSGVISYSITYPLDYIRTVTSVDIGRKNNRKYRSINNFIKVTYNLEGIKGFYKGLSISVLSVLIYRSLYFGLYDFGKSQIDNYKNFNFLEKFMFAQLVTIISETISYPIDTIHRKMMLNTKDKHYYTNSYECFQKIKNISGYKGFFKGYASNLLRSINSSLILIFYDEFNLYIKIK